jgi:radical SAM superfamily enzyme YgiQ (UPF0313 family)
MKILFLEIDTHTKWELAATGPGFIASYISQYGHESAMIRIHPQEDIAQIILRIKIETPDIIGFSISTHQWPRALYIAGELKQQLDISLIAGGLHPTFASEQVLNTGKFDGVCIGEGEEAVCEVLSFLENNTSLNGNKIKNIRVKNAPFPQLRPPIKDIDAIPFVARALLDEHHGVFNMSTQRGCPFPCTYCAAGAIKKLYAPWRYVRRRSVKNVMEELGSIKQKLPLNYVVFLDDTFTLNKNWVQDFCSEYGREFGIGFSIHARAETIDPEMIDMLARAGCKHIAFGVESGSMRVRKQIMNRPVDNIHYHNTFRWAKSAGILTTANYMMGLPGETPGDIEQTLAFNKALDPDDFGFFVFYPFPGTDLYHLCKENNYLPENHQDLHAKEGHSILNLPDLTCDDISDFYGRFKQIRDDLYKSRYNMT